MEIPNFLKRLLYGSMTGKRIEHEDGAIYEGEFKDGKLVRGTKTWPDGHTEEGEFDSEGRFVEGTRVSVTYPDGTKYEGKWKNRKFVTVTKNGKLVKSTRIFTNENNERRNPELRKLQRHKSKITKYQNTRKKNYKRKT